MPTRQVPRRSAGAAAVFTAAAAFAVVSCGGPRPESGIPPRTQSAGDKKDSAGPTILAPRKDDVVGKSFSVEGSGPRNPGTVKVTCVGSGTSSATPGWSFPFSSPTAGPASASAMYLSPDSGDNSVSFVISDDPPLEVEDSDVEPTPAPDPAAAPRPAAVTHNYRAKVKYKGPGTPTKVELTLFHEDGTQSGPEEAQRVGMSPIWAHRFTGVKKGFYGVQAKVTYTDAGGNTVTKTHTKMDKIP